MPIIDRDIGVDKKKYKVSKEGLDPFGAQRQAMRMVRSELDAPMGPNIAGLDYGVEDRGDYYEITVEEREHRAGPRGIARARDAVGRAPDNKGTDRAEDILDDKMHYVDRPGKRSSGMDGAGEGGSFDLQSRLNNLYTVPELREEVRRAGVYVSQNARKDDIIRALANEAPYRARQMTGRQ